MSWPWATAPLHPRREPSRSQISPSPHVALDVEQCFGSSGIGHSNHHPVLPLAGNPQQYSQSLSLSGISSLHAPTSQSRIQHTGIPRRGRSSSIHEDKSCAHEKSNTRYSRQVERELAHAREVLARLGQTMPGDSAQEIARYVAERKRNWPRATRIIPNGNRCPAVNALMEVADCYGGDDPSEEEENGSKTHLPSKLNSSGLLVGANRNSQKRVKNRPSSVIRKQPLGSRTSNLLAQLLKNEVVREHQTLLGAFEYLLCSM